MATAVMVKLSVVKVMMKIEVVLGILMLKHMSKVYTMNVPE